MRDDEGKPDSPRSAVDLSFAAFSLTHAECGEEGVIELRLGDRLLLEWCPSCATLKTFRSLND
jgi:hypothetical protein